MRLFTSTFYLLAAVVFSTASAQTNPSNNGAPQRTIDISKIPSCGLICMAKTAPQSGCSLTDVDCVCNSHKMIDLTTKCALQECSTADASTLSNLQADLCQYGHEDKTAESKRLVLAFSIVNKIVVPLRLVLRYYTQGSLAWDDWLISAAFCTDTVAFYAAFRVFDSGLGKHIWDVDPANLHDFLIWSTVSMATYIVSSGLIKLSVLAFYLRIFTVSPRFSILCWMNVVLCICLVIPFLFISIFQCIPVSNAFKIAPGPGYCVNLNAATWSHSAFNVFQDVVIVVMPILEVMRLQMSWRKKLGVSIIFLLGGFVVVASVVRMFFIPGFGRTSDPTWSNVPTFLWSAMELGVGQLCACIPGIYSGLRHVWPGFRNFTRTHLSQKGSKTSEESRDEFKKSSRLSGIPSGARYVRAGGEVPLTIGSKDERDGRGRGDMYDLDEMEGRSREGETWYRQESQERLDIEKRELKQDLRKGGGIEATTTVSVSRTPRNISFDGRS